MTMLLMQMAIEGYGVAWLPQSAAAPALDSGQLVKAGGNEWSSELEIRAYCSLANQNPTMRELWETLGKASREVGE